MDSQVSDHLPGFPVAIALPVQWGDQDAFGHVNNTVYFRWYESARIAYTEQIGLLDLLQREKIGPILAAIDCNYRRPVTYPDTVEIGARVMRIGRTSFTMQHKVYSHALGMVCAEGDSTVVVYSYVDSKSHPVPDSIRAEIEKIEGKSFS